MKPRHGIVHILFHPVSAKRFVEPLVKALIEEGHASEVWVEPVAGTEGFLSSIKVPLKVCPSNLSINPLKTLLTLAKLLRNLAESRPQAIYAHLMRGAFLPLVAASILKIPVRIYHNHGVPYIAYKGPLRWAFLFLEWANCSLATDIVTDSAGMRPALQALIKKGRTVVTYGPGSPCGLAPEEFGSPNNLAGRSRSRALYGLQPGDLVMAYIGRPHKRKGFDLTLQGFEAMFANRSDVKLLVCGCKEEDVTRILQKKVSNIAVLGYLQNLLPVYEASNIVLLPSFHEGFGNCLLEGAAQGCALLASNIPGPDILVEPDKNGFLVEPGDLEDFKRTLARIDGDRPKLAEMGVDAYQKALLFRREIVIASYLKFMAKTGAFSLTTGAFSLT